MPKSAIALTITRLLVDDEIGKIFGARMVSDLELKPTRRRTPVLPEEKRTGLEVPPHDTPPLQF
jgi:hypothetical protein